MDDWLKAQGTRTLIVFYVGSSALTGLVFTVVFRALEGSTQSFGSQFFELTGIAGGALLGTTWRALRQRRQAARPDR